MKNILVPTDFSEVSINAVKVAADITRKNVDNILTIVHVYDMQYAWSSPMDGSDPGELFIDKEQTEPIQNELRNRMHKLLASDFLEGLKVKSLILADTEIHEIVNHEKVGPQDLVVMGTHGSKGFKDFFVGSNTEKFLRHSSVPVLSIKNYTGKAHFSNMVFASDFGKDAVKNFGKIKGLAENFGAHIFLVKIITPINFEDSSASEEDIDLFIKATGLTNCTRHIYNHISVEDGILKFAEKVNADSIALETHGRTGIAHIISGSITEDVTSRSDIPVISVKMDK